MAVMHCRPVVLTGLGTGPSVPAAPTCSGGLTEALFGPLQQDFTRSLQEITGRLSPLALTGLHWDTVTREIWSWSQAKLSF